MYYFHIIAQNVCIEDVISVFFKKNNIEQPEKNEHSTKDKPPQGKLGKDINENIKMFKDIFKNDDTLVIREFENSARDSVRLCCFYIDGMVNTKVLNDDIMRPAMYNTTINKDDDVITLLQEKVVFSNEAKKSSELSKLIEAILYGDTILIADGSSDGLILNTKGWQTRGITEPEAEKVERGPREGFTEAILVNLSMIRRKLKTQDLKFGFKEMGAQTHTKVCVCYIDGIVNKSVLKEVNKRLDKINIDGIIDSGYISEMIKDEPLSPIKTVGSTERPDIVAAKLLEGRVAIVVDGTPMVLTAPHLFVEYFQTNDDYYVNYIFSSINRILRILGSFISISIPAVYLAFVTYHQELIPTSLLLSISASRKGVPVPTIVEILLILFAFELLREASIRMPSNIGSALSIVGALVLGQASVEAKLISAPMVIVVAITGITGLMIIKLKGATIIARLFLLLLSSFFGMYGYVFGMVGMLIYLCTIRSFGIPIMQGISPSNLADLQDGAVRTPWFNMKYRPKFLAPDNQIRSNNNSSDDKGGKQ